MRIRHTFVLIVVAASLTAACVDTPPQSGPSIPEPTAEAHTPAPVCRPLLLGLQRDRTGSARKTATPDITREHLDAFIDLVRVCGGEIAVGDICRQSFTPLTRLRIEEPPLPPVEPVWSPNPYEHQQQLVAFQPQLQAYEHAAARHTATTDAAVAAFKEAAWPRLSSAPTCDASDVAGAVNRSLLFLGEIGGGWSRPPRLAIVLASDARHNTGKWDVTLPEDIEVLLVNGIGSRGALAAAPNVHLFESLAGATRYLRLEE